MPNCNGCSRKFPYLKTGIRCGRCQSKAANQDLGWPECHGCGELYEFLDGQFCATCDAFTTGPGATAINAMSAPANPRTRYPASHLDLPIPIPSAHPEPDELAKIRAQKVLASVAAAHSNAVERARDLQIGTVAKSKLKGMGTRDIIPTCKNIVVRISKVVNANAKKAPPSISPFMASHAANLPWSEVVEVIRLNLDYHYTNLYNHRILSGDIQFHYAAKDALLDPIHCEGTLGELWGHSTGGALGKIAVKEADRRNLLFDLVAYVDYPVLDVEDYETPRTTITRSTRAAKRKLDSTTLGLSGNVYPHPKRANFSRASNVYTTSIRSQRAVYTVEKVECHVSDESTKWHVVPETFRVEIDLQQTACGTTKKMYKLTIGDVHYAAKAFYFNGIADHVITSEENQKHLREELLRQTIASKSMRRFSDQVRESKVSAIDISVADSFLLFISEGLNKGFGWLVDPLLSSTDVIKFSGTVEAGVNRDLLGQTCDAFAHFSLYDSGGQLVFVDIQGIRTPRFVQGVRTVDALSLFDMMSHTKDMSSGLGDGGPSGIAQFCEQHRCNQICHSIGLPDPHTLRPPPSSSCSPPDDAPRTDSIDDTAASHVNLDFSGETSAEDDDRTVVCIGKGCMIPLEDDSGGFQAGVDYGQQPPQRYSMFCDSTHTVSFGPFNIVPMTLTSLKSAKSTTYANWDLRFALVGQDMTKDTIHYKEVCRYVDAADLVSTFEEAILERHLQAQTTGFTIMDLSIAETQRPAVLDNWVLSSHFPKPEWHLETCSGTKPLDPTDSLLHRTLHAFSHFSWTRSRGEKVFKDFEYVISGNQDKALVVYFRTHTDTNRPRNTYYGDMGANGIGRFRSGHRCNGICQALGLPSFQ